MMSRTITIFLESINSEITRKQYLYYLQNFVKYFKLRDVESIITIDSKKLQEMVEDYVIHLKRKKMSYSYINGHKSALKALVETTDMLLNWPKISRLMPVQEKKRGQKAWKRKEIERMLDFSNKAKTRALILFLTCGCRIGAIPDMKIRDMTDMPGGCKKLVVYRGSKDEYVTFLTPEASEAFDIYMKKRKNDGEYMDINSPLFRSNYQLGMQKVKPVTARSLSNVMRRIQIVSGLRDSSTKIRGRYEVATDHGFRKYFNTTAKLTNGINRTIIETMMGHNSKEIKLDTEYFDEDMVPELSFEEFKKIIPELTIDDSARKQAKLESKEKEVSELQNANKEIKRIKDDIKQMVLDILAEEKDCGIKN